MRYNDLPQAMKETKAKAEANETDIQKIGDLATLQTTNKVDIVSAMNELFQNASNGKQLILDALVAKGHTTITGDSTFQDLADAIGLMNAIQLVGGLIEAPRDGLVAEYLFNDSGNLGLDTSGNGNHGVVNGTVGHSDGCAVFTGNGYIDLGTKFKDINFGLSNYTIATRLKIKSGFSRDELDRGIIGLGSNFSNIALNASGNLAPYIYNGSYLTIEDTDKKEDQFINLTFSQNATDSVASFYVNGVLIGTVAGLSTSYARYKDAIGAYFGTTNYPYYFDGGEIDYVRAYNKALSNKEIMQLTYEGMVLEPLYEEGTEHVSIVQGGTYPTGTNVYTEKVDHLELNVDTGGGLRILTENMQDISEVMKIVIDAENPDATTYISAFVASALDYNSFDRETTRTFELHPLLQLDVSDLYSSNYIGLQSGSGGTPSGVTKVHNIWAIKAPPIPNTLEIGTVYKYDGSINPDPIVAGFTKYAGLGGESIVNADSVTINTSSTQSLTYGVTLISGLEVAIETEVKIISSTVNGGATISLCDGVKLYQLFLKENEISGNVGGSHSIDMTTQRNIKIACNAISGVVINVDGTDVLSIPYASLINYTSPHASFGDITQSLGDNAHSQWYKFTALSGNTYTKDTQADALYYLGNENVPITGGWSEGYSNGTGSQEKKNDELYLTAGHATQEADRTFVTNNPIDFSTFNTLKIEWENAGENVANNASRLIVSSVKDGNSITFDARLDKSFAFNEMVDSLDVSGLTGSYYIRVHARDATTAVLSTSTLNIKKIIAIK